MWAIPFFHALPLSLSLALGLSYQRMLPGLASCIYHLSFEWGRGFAGAPGAAFSTFAHLVISIFVFVPKLFCDIYPTYLGRTQQPPVRVAGRRDPKMALACPAAAVRAAPSGADVGRHSCADAGPNLPTWESPPPSRLPLSAAPRWCCLWCNRWSFNWPNKTRSHWCRPMLWAWRGSCQNAASNGLAAKWRLSARTQIQFKLNYYYYKEE